ncbi:FtsW/RodA/SpoVE family cell cycle protein [Embleya sp. NPDC020630]|uniref:FtsW/RodA/SpoVE family cell cycle protein n=1 Tax=Embleya sp. NPDC020630 TaxID=3363979 RepID=UPI0037A93AEC
MTDRREGDELVPNRRGTELAMLGFAVLVILSAFANVALAGGGSLSTDVAAYSFGIGVPALLGHLAIRRFAPYADPLLLPLATLLNGIGMVLIYRIGLDPARGSRKALQTAPTQLMWSVAGIEVVLTVFFAGYLMAKRDALALAGRTVMGLPLPRGRDLGPILAAWLPSLLILVFERDLGTSLLFFGMFVVLLYIATERTSWLMFGLVLSATGAVLVGSVEPHVKSRVHALLDPMYYYDLVTPGLTDSDQAAQALFGFGTGGMLGTGLNQGHAGEIGFAANSDFILTSVGEELGLAGMMVIFMLYALLIERGLRTALAARDPFGKLLAAGLAVVMALQVFVVAGGVIGLIPLTGMTMPFLAQGGSSVITNWALVAILIVVGDAARRPVPSTSVAVA